MYIIYYFAFLFNLALRDDNFLSINKQNKEKYFTLNGDAANLNVTKPTGAVNVHSFSSGCLCCSKPLISQFESVIFYYVFTITLDCI